MSATKGVDTGDTKIPPDHSNTNLIKVHNKSNVNVSKEENNISITFQSQEKEIRNLEKVSTTKADFNKNVGISNSNGVFGKLKKLFKF